MKRFIRTLAIGLLSFSLLVPTVEAQGRRQGAGSHAERNDSRGNSGRGGNRAGQRPGASSSSRPDRAPSHNNGGGNHGNNNNRPGNNHQGGNHQGNHRPGNNRPDGNHQGNHRPGNNRPEGNHQGNHRPGGNNHRPGGNHQGNFRPGGNNHRPSTSPPPHRPGGNHGYHGHKPHHYHKPPMHHPPFHRPVPPPSFRPGHRYPTFGTILGVALGSAFNVSLNYFYNNGYAVDGYSGNQLYLRNVSQMNYMWPEAVMYYNNGYLSGSQFIHPANYYDTSRYYNLYNTFCNQYGMPVNVSNGGGTMSATWFGYGNRYVTINFTQGYNEFGSPCYYTTLSFGN